MERYWFYLVMPYIKNEEILSCPSRPWAGARCGCDAVVGRPSHPSYDMPCSSDLWGDQSMGVTRGAPRYGARADHEVRALAETIYVSDLYCSPTTMDPTAGGGIVSRMRDERSSRHNDGFNALYVDGHVKWLREPRYEDWVVGRTPPGQY